MDHDTASRQLLAIGNPTRLALYRLLVRAGPEGLRVGDLRDRLGLPGSTLSHHLRTLLQAGLIVQERDGTTLFCRAAYPAMQALVDYLVGECCADTEAGSAT